VLVNDELNGPRALTLLSALFTGDALDPNISAHVGQVDAVLTVKLLDEGLEGLLLRS
jgi:hypothetical protein